MFYQPICLRVYRISLLGGIDAIVFTGGIGEHAAAIRAQICSSLSWIGVNLDTAKNTAAKSAEELLLSSPHSKVEIWLIPTDEESVIAQHTLTVVSASNMPFVKMGHLT